MQWAQRVLGSTRGQIVGLLCYGPRTVGEVSKTLRLTPNGVRDHLAALEADGLVKRAGEKRHIGKPAHLFELTSSGRLLLSTAYRPVLHGLLDVIAERYASSVDEIIRAAGQRVAANYPKATGDLRKRAEKGAAVLREFGGEVEVAEEGDGLVIRGVCCPLAEVVPDHPESCKVLEGLLMELLGEPVKEFCDKTPPLKCQFVLRSPEPAAAKKRRRSAR
jgi:predicted ArsR family transcriptional regulator